MSGEAAASRNFRQVRMEGTDFNYGKFATIKSLLNMALFGKTAKQWRDEHPGNKGNIRDEANASQLVCLPNMEALDAHFIQQRLPRLTIPNQTAIQQMKLLLADTGMRQLEGKKKS